MTEAELEALAISRGGKVTRMAQAPETAPCGPALDCSEKEFHAAVIEAATKRGWTHYHTWRSDKSDKGWPDLVLARRGFNYHIPGRIIFAELKSETGKMTEDQTEWCALILAARQEYYVWRPSNWSLILEILR